MESVYLETTVISYLVARPSRDVVVAAHQQTTHEWWDTRRLQFECYVSQVVIDEVSAGDPGGIEKRLDVINRLSVLEIPQTAERLAQAIILSGAIPPRAVRDAAILPWPRFTKSTICSHGIAATWQMRKS